MKKLKYLLKKRKMILNINHKIMVEYTYNEINLKVINKYIINYIIKKN